MTDLPNIAPDSRSDTILASPSQIPLRIIQRRVPKMPPNVVNVNAIGHHINTASIFPTVKL